MTSPQSQEHWVDVGTVADIPRIGARVVATSFGNIAVFRTEHDQVKALEDRCPHLGGPLSQGIVHDLKVTCPLHNWVIDLGSGEVVGPDEGCVAVVPVRLEDNRIHLDISVLAARAAAA